MRKIRDILRLSFQGVSTREMALSLSIGRTTLREYLHCARKAGIRWPLPEDLSDSDLERLLFPPISRDGNKNIPLPDWNYIHSELRRDGVTLLLLWEEYCEVHTDGYGYSRFCELYTGWEGKLSPVMRQRHRAGEQLFVDYAGSTIDIVDPATGEIHAAQIFVASLGACNYTYMEASWT